MIVNEVDAMKEEPITFNCAGLSLEGLIARSAVPSAAEAAVICHPHPMYGGSMYNNVVDAIVQAMWRLGRATLRFNFRGVGESEGEYDDGEGEIQDAGAAAAYLAGQPGIRSDRLILAGYSFGAAVAVRAGQTEPLVDRVVAVALPIAMIVSRARLAARKPLLMLSGDRDDFSPRSGLEQIVKDAGAHARIEMIAGADHFFGGYENDLTDRIVRALSD